MPATHITTPDGKRIYIRAKTKEELEKKKLEYKMQMGVGVDIADSTKFEEYAELWLNVYKKPDVRETSYDTIESNVRNHVTPYFKGMALKDIKPIHIKGFVNSMSGLSSTTRNHCFHWAKSIFQTAEDNGIIYKTPVRATDKPKIDKKEEEPPLTNEQANALLKAVKGTTVYLFCLIALSTGMRRGEILGLMWDDIYDGKIHVRHNKAIPGGKCDAPVTDMLKTDAARREIPVSRVLRTALAEEKIRSTSPYVMSMSNGKSYTKGAFKSMWKIVKARTATPDSPLGTVKHSSRYGSFKVSLDFTCHPHQLRHTFCTQMFEAGLDIKQVQYLMGHSTPDLTLRIYTHYRKDRDDKTAEMVEEALEYLG